MLPAAEHTGLTHCGIMQYTSCLEFMCMRTNIDIDDDLLKEAQAVTGLKTKKAVVDEALSASSVVEGSCRR